MVNYQNAKIYKIVCNKTGLTYFGSTCQSIAQRMASHRRKYKNILENDNKKKRDYCSSFEIIKNNDYYYELVCYCPCNSKEELMKTEGSYIRNNECCNKYIPDRTKKEYDNLHKEKITNYRKQYYESNKDKIKQQTKEYRELNKVKIKQQKKEYREKNQDKINQKKREKYKQKKLDLLQLNV